MNKLIKMATLVAGVCAMLGLAGCGGGGTPDSIAKEVVACLKDADLKGISKYATDDFKKGIGMLKGMMEADEKGEMRAEFKKDFGSKKYEFGTAVIEGDKAKVPVKIDGKEKAMKFVKVDGQWMVDDFNFKDM